MISSPSMSPTINVGDLVIYSPCATNDLYANHEKGDIVVIKGPEYYYQNGVDPYLWNNLPNGTKIVHRLVHRYFDDKTGDYFFETRGDNNDFSDGCLKGDYEDGYGIFKINESDPILIPDSEIIGRIDLIIPKLGLMTLYSSQIIIGIIITAALYYIIQRRFSFQITTKSADKSPLMSNSH